MQTRYYNAVIQTGSLISWGWWDPGVVEAKWQYLIAKDKVSAFTINGSRDVPVIRMPWPTEIFGSD